MSVSEYMRSISSQSQIKNASSTRQSSRKSKHSKSSGNIIPQKDLDNEKPTKSLIPRQCKCGPDLYSRVLGPTADETILTGLQTVIDLCNKLRVCGDKDESEDDQPEKELLSIAESEIPERDNVPNAQSQTDSKNIITAKSQTDSKEMMSAGFQVNPSMVSAEAQTLPYPEMVSEILETIGLTPELASKIVQTSFISIAEPDKPIPEAEKVDLASIFMQTSNASLHSNAMQTTYPDLRSGFVQTSSRLLPKIQETTPEIAQPTSVSQKSVAGTQSDSVSTASKQTMADNISCRSIRSVLKPPSEVEVTKDHAFKVEQAIIGDEHKCISPPEPPASNKTCKCCKCSSSSHLHKDPSKESRKSLNGNKKKCICCKKTSKCRCSSDPSCSSTSIPGDKESPQEVKYAVTRISKFKEFTTFEVMKSTRNVPKQIPKSIEGVFVLKQQKNNNKSKEKIVDKKENGSKDKEILEDGYYVKV